MNQKRIFTDEIFLPENTWNKKFIDLSSSFRDITIGSQGGEAGVVQAIFRHCKPQNKFCVEVGASDGYDCSNTWQLIDEHGWSSLQIEILPHLYEQLTERHKNNPKVKCINDKLERENFDKILSANEVPENFDLLSLDIDSYEYEVWKNLADYKPNLVVIEGNAFEYDLSVINYDPSYSVVTNSRGYGSATVGLYLRLAEIKGYSHICTLRQNSFFIRKEFEKGLLK